MCQVRNSELLFLIEIENCPGLGGIGAGLLYDGGEKERTPTRPVTFSGHGKQPVVVFVPVGFQVRADIEVGAGQKPLVHEIERNEQSAQTAIAVQEGVDGLELRVDDRQLNKFVRSVGMNVALPG